MSTAANVAPDEVEKFGRLAEMWWDPRGPMHSLHAVNPLRTQFIAEAVELRGKRTLDVGCGAGLLTESLARLGARATGLDLATELVETARLHAAQQGLQIDYQSVSVEDLAARQPASFDVVSCMEVLEHIPDPAATVRACAHALVPGGQAFFSTIDRTPIAFLFAIVGGEYILRLLPRGSHTYRMLIRPAELKAWSQAAGLVHKRSEGIGYNPLTRRFRRMPRTDVNYMMHFVKPS